MTRCISYTLTLVSFFVLAVFSACAVRLAPREIVAASASAAGEAEPELKAQRAQTPLAQVTPAVAAPKRPESLEPVSERAAKQLEAAQRLAREQRFTEATLELERALRYDPNHPDIHRALAWLNLQAGNLERARDHATRALEVNPDDAVCHYVLGRVAAQTAEPEAASRAWRTALLCTDFGADAQVAGLTRYYLAEQMAAEGYLRAALELYEAFEQQVAASLEAVDREHDASAESGALAVLRGLRQPATEARAALLAQLNRPAQAADALQALVAQRPDDVELGCRYARLLLDAGRAEEALAAARTLKGDPDRIAPLLNDICARLEAPGELVFELTTRMKAEPEVAGWVLHLADTLEGYGQHERASHALGIYLAEHPSAEAVRLRLVDLLEVREQWAAVLQVCAEGLKQQPEGNKWRQRFLALARNPIATAVLLNPTCRVEEAAPSYLLGELALRAGKPEEARRWFEQSHRLTPDFVPARVALAELNMQAYQWDEALKLLQRDDPQVPEAPPQERALAQVYLALDEVNQAQLHLKAALQAAPRDPDLMYELALAYQSSNETNLAQQQLQALLDVEPTYAPALEMLAGIYLDRQLVGEAMHVLEQLKELKAAPFAAARAAALLELFGQPDPVKYRATLQAALEEHGPDAVTWIAVGDSYAPTGRSGRRDAWAQTPAARAAYLQALAQDLNNEEAALNLVRADFDLLDFEAAAQRLEQLMPRRPNRHSWRFRLINIYLDMQDWQVALTCARTQEQRADLTEGNRAAYRTLILQTLRLAGRDDELLTQLQAWSEQDSDNVAWSLMLAQEYQRLARAAEAVTLLEARHRAAPADGDVLRSLLAALLAAGQPDRACQYALGQLNDDPESDLALMQLIGVLFDAERFDEGLELLENELLYSRNPARFQQLKLVGLSQAGRHSEAAELLEQLIAEQLAAPQSRPWDLDELRRQLVIELLLAEEPGQAKDQLEYWREHQQPGPAPIPYYQVWALYHQRQGNPELAAQASEEALGFYPDDVPLNNDVAYNWIDRGVKLAEAEQMIRYAVSQEPRQSAYLDTFGWLLYKQGKWEEARKWLRRASHTEFGQDPVIFDHLGDTCFRLGKTEDAVECWETAVRLAEEGDDTNPDAVRTRREAPAKLQAVREGNVPELAPVAPKAEVPESERVYPSAEFEVKPKG